MAVMVGSQVTPYEFFDAPWYLAHNAMRQHHLASLGLAIEGRKVLELGAGIGGHTKFFVERGCEVTTTDGRQDNVDILGERWPSTIACCVDVESPDGWQGKWDIVSCYGLLYHLANPITAMKNMAKWCGDLLLIETCVATSGADEFKRESSLCSGHSLSGVACLLAPSTIVATLKGLFPFVYRSKTHPMGMAFDVPIDWVDPRGECRAVFVASRSPIADTRALVLQ